MALGKRGLEANMIIRKRAAVAVADFEAHYARTQAHCPTQVDTTAQEAAVLSQALQGQELRLDPEWPLFRQPGSKAQRWTPQELNALKAAVRVHEVVWQRGRQIGNGKWSGIATIFCSILRVRLDTESRSMHDSLRVHCEKV